MSTAALIPLEEYLAHTYEPDCEYVGGELVERHVGEHFHSLLLTLLVEYLALARQSSGVSFRTKVEQRMRVREGYDRERRYRIPDVMIMAPGYRRTTVTLDPPVVTIEILSPDDDLAQNTDKCREYAAFGVAVPIIADPYARRIYVVGVKGREEVASRQVPFTVGDATVTIDFNQLFADLDRE